MRPLPFVPSVAFALGLAIATPSTSSARQGVEVTCGVQGGANGVQHYMLMTDLDCTGIPSSLQLAKGDRLHLNGHTLRGVAILAFGNVRIFGPGTITGVDGDGIRHSKGQLTVREVTVTGNTGHGVDSMSGKVKLESATVTGNGTDPDCGTTLACADVAVCERAPQLRSSICGRSYRLESGIPGETLGLGVCVDG